MHMHLSYQIKALTMFISYISHGYYSLCMGIMAIRTRRCLIAFSGVGQRGISRRCLRSVGWYSHTSLDLQLERAGIHWAQILPAY